MLAPEFARILKTFADKPEDIDISKGNLIFQIRDDIFEAAVSQKSGELFVNENGIEVRAAEWLVKRIARAPLLADRILDYIKEPDNFVTPSGLLLDQLDHIQPEKSEQDIPIADVSNSAAEVLGRRPAGTSSILYLTSDAGEGKTTLINHLARSQALAYKAGKSDWLLVPIPLGGRGFLRFDDVVIAALANKLRFQWWYFDSFLELVRLGVVIPAFDGFEEMFVEGSSGEALSALGTLMRNLQSQGSALIAARKAYFEYQSFKTQAKLFDTIGSSSVSFARLSLQRWDKDKFTSYAAKRGADNPEKIYETVSTRLGDKHPLLTRPVLVRRLLDVTKEKFNIDALVKQLGSTPQDYFYQFVNAIVDREANEKWLTKAGELQIPTLTIDEHYELLCAVAQEMWLSSTDALKPEVLDVIADIFSESKKKDPANARQIKERLKQHSLLTIAETVRSAFSFDHEDFRKFFLGEAIGRLLAKNSRQDLHGILGVGPLPKETAEHAIHYFLRNKGDTAQTINLICDISSAELPTSFVRENAGALLASLIDRSAIQDVRIEHLNFPPEALSGKTFKFITFSHCYFQPTPLIQTNLFNCNFHDCQFERIEVSNKFKAYETLLDDCEISSLIIQESDEQLFEPSAIHSFLLSLGFKSEIAKTVDSEFQIEREEEVQLLERVLRIFLRATQVNERVIQLRLGHKNSVFFANVLPSLLRERILIEVPYLGSGTQRRFKLSVPMENIQLALSQCDGKFENFIKEFSSD